MTNPFLRRVAVTGLCTLVAGCGDPLSDVARLSEIEIAEGAAAANVAPAPEETADAPGFLGTLFGGNRAAPAPGAEAAETTDTAAAPAPARGGFWGLFGRSGNSAPPAAVTGAAGANDPDDPDAGPDAARIAPGATLPYGTIATVCGLSDAALGAAVATGSGYVVHDPAPQSIALRTHYITGFPDGCARQFSAALVMFGDIGTHEIVRYETSDATQPFSATDIAYEEIKAAFCGVAAGQPCGNRIDRLARNTTFLTVYENFGTNPGWADILLHDGAVVAMDFEGN